jgi:hypothetical protein
MQVGRVAVRLLLGAVAFLWFWRQLNIISRSLKLHVAVSMPESAQTQGLLLVQPTPTCKGKTELLTILKAAGMKNISTDTCARLPRWKDVARFYGAEPIVYGLDTCERYRALLSAEANNGTAVEPMVRVAGLYNTGTNALGHLLSYNVKDLGHHQNYDVPWNKHAPPEFKWEKTNLNNNESKAHVLPVVLIREPFWWMQSMVSSRRRRSLFRYVESTQWC